MFISFCLFTLKFRTQRAAVSGIINCVNNSREIINYYFLRLCDRSPVLLFVIQRREVYSVRQRLYRVGLIYEVVVIWPC